jgi:predicted nucleic acid-binding protein
MLLATALESGACYIVSEDRHLRDLRQWRNVKIMSRDEFIAELDRLRVP